MSLVNNIVSDKTQIKDNLYDKRLELFRVKIYRSNENSSVSKKDY